MVHPKIKPCRIPSVGRHVALVQFVDPTFFMGFFHHPTISGCNILANNIHGNWSLWRLVFPQGVPGNADDVNSCMVAATVSCHEIVESEMNPCIHQKIDGCFRK